MVRVCRALDGMPLAIELAAARLRTMSIDQLANRLDDRFRLLTSGSRTALPRHRTLRAVVDWSWELLTDAERMVLRRLSVFSGGASLEAAERVCAGDAVEQEQVLELLTSLAEKSLLVTEGDGAPRYRMLGTIKEYAADRLAEAGESDLARQAHLAYFTELAETAEPHLRRAEQLEWLATLEAEHDNISAAMRGAIAAGDAQAAMRLAAAAGWYWWLGGRRAEGIELMIAATNIPGEVTDDVRAMTYALVVLFVTSGRGDEHLGAEWIHKAYRFSQQSQHRNPLLGFVAPLERLLQAPEAAVPAFESLLDSDDPWVRALARLAGRQDADHARPGRPGGGGPSGAGARRVPGARRTVRDFVGPVRAGGPTRHARRVRRCLRALRTGDRGPHRGRRHRGCHRGCGPNRPCCTGSTAISDASAAAIAEAERCAEGVTWPYALVELALAKAELARWGGDAEEARRQLGLATTLLGDAAEQANIRAGIHDLLGYLADDLREARTHRVAAWQAASEAGHPPPDRPDTRRGRGPGSSPRPVRTGGAVARGQRRRPRTAGSLPPGCGQDRAGRAASPRRSTVRRGDAGGYADELVSAGRGHARFVRVSLLRVE